jgi:hypothetical protein
MWILTILFLAVGGIGLFGGALSGLGFFRFEFLNSFELPLGHLEGIALDSQGNIYCGLQYYSRIQAYDEGGKFRWGRFINSAGGAFRIRINENDQLEVATARNDKLYRFDEDGTLVTELSDVHRYYGDFGKAGERRYWVESQNVTYVITTSLLGGCVAKRDSFGEEQIVIRTPFHKWLFMGPFPAFFFFFIGIISLTAARRDGWKRLLGRHLCCEKTKKKKDEDN